MNFSKSTYLTHNCISVVINRFDTLPFLVNYLIFAIKKKKITNIRYLPGSLIDRTLYVIKKNFYLLVWLQAGTVLLLAHSWSELVTRTNAVNGSNVNTINKCLAYLFLLYKSTFIMMLIYCWDSEF